MTNRKKIYQKIADKVSKDIKGGVETVKDYGVKCAEQGLLSGFNIAMNLVYETLNGGDFTLAYTMTDVIGIIEDEEDLYRKDEMNIPKIAQIIPTE